MDINELVFNPSTHEYTWGETKVPSVTTLITVLSPNPYSKVPKRILQKAADYGNVVHEAIENHALGKVQDEVEGFAGIALRRYEKLEKQHDIVITSCEQRMLYFEDDKPLYAGTYDMLGVIKGKTSLIDIKTTADLHTDMLKYQLCMYKAALEQMNHFTIDKCYCLWMPKKKLGRLIEIEVPDIDVILPLVRKAAKHFEPYEPHEEETSEGQ